MRYFWQELSNLYPELEFSGEAFRPTGTSQVLYEALITIPISKSLDILELGCGSGVITLGMNQKIQFNHNYHLSVVSTKAVNLSRKNFKVVNLVGDIRQSNIFESWANKKFNLIINDISGVPEEIGEKFSWFEHSVNDSGNDGTLLSLKVINEAEKYLKKNGSLVMPIISLSDSVKLMSALNSRFKKVTCLKKSAFPLQQDEKTIKKWLKKYDFIDVKKIGAFYTFDTSIYLAKEIR